MEFLLKPFMKYLLIALAVGAAIAAFVYMVHSYGKSEYERGKSDKTSEVLLSQQTLLRELQTKVEAVGKRTDESATAIEQHAEAIQTQTDAVIADARKRVLVIAGPDGKCNPTPDLITDWNRLNRLAK